MKKLLFVLIALVSMATYGQTLTPDMLNMPQVVFDASENVVIKQRTYIGIEILPVTKRTVRSGVTTYSKSHTIRYRKNNIAKYGTSLAMFSYYGLNLSNDYLNYHGFTYTGSNDSALVFQSNNGEAYLVRSGANYKFHVVSHPNEYTSIENGPSVNGRQQKIFVKHSRAKVDSLCKAVFKYDILEMERRCMTTFHGSIANPQTDITSIFSYAELVGNEVVNRTFINGRPYNQVNYGQMRTAQGKTGVGINFQWRYYNECNPLGTVDSDMTGFGNEGQCGKSDQLLANDNRAKSTFIEYGSAFNLNKATNTATFDSSKSSWIVLYMGETPWSGKEQSNQCYLDLSTGICYTFAPLQ